MYDLVAPLTEAQSVGQIPSIEAPLYIGIAINVVALTLPAIIALVAVLLKPPAKPAQRLPFDRRAA